MLDSVKAGVLDFLYGVYLKDKSLYTSGKRLEDLKRFALVRGSTVGRRCRELAADGMTKTLYQPIGKGSKLKRVWYAWKKPSRNIVLKKQGKST